MKYLKLFEQDWWNEESEYDHLFKEKPETERYKLCKEISLFASIPINYLENLTDEELYELYFKIASQKNI